MIGVWKDDSIGLVPSVLTEAALQRLQYVQEAKGFIEINEHTHRACYLASQVICWSWMDLVFAGHDGS